MRHLLSGSQTAALIPTANLKRKTETSDRWLVRSALITNWISALVKMRFCKCKRFLHLTQKLYCGGASSPLPLVQHWCSRSVSDVGAPLPHQFPSLIMYEQIWFINPPHPFIPQHKPNSICFKVFDYIICDACLSAWFCNSEHNEAQWIMWSTVMGEFHKVCANYKVETIFLLFSLFPTPA